MQRREYKGKQILKTLVNFISCDLIYFILFKFILFIFHYNYIERERSGSVVECLTGD